MDQQEPYRVYQANQMSMEGTLVQVSDLDKMRMLMPPAIRAANSSDLRYCHKAATGANVTAYGLRHQANLDSPEYGYAMIYHAINSTPFSFAVNRRDLTKVNFRFDARPVFSRPTKRSDRTIHNHRSLREICLEQKNIAAANVSGSAN